jgi:succinate dehydrogenase / fumarate reductase cytochrome b subunit
MVVILEWTFIFIPILFHALVGLWIISGGLPNTASYPYGSNVRYTLQRATGIIVAFFIVFHIWQMHHLGRAIGGGKFDPEHAATSAAIVLDPLFMKIVYTVGTLCAVYHLANGVWTFGITWGIWTSDHAQRRAGYFCAAFGLLVASLGLGSLYGMSVLDLGKARIVENNIQTIRAAERGEIQLVAPQPAPAANTAAQIDLIPPKRLP